MEEREVFERLVADIGGNSLPFAAALVIIALIILALAASLAGRLGALMGETRQTYEGMQAARVAHRTSYKPNEMILARNLASKSRRTSNKLV